MTQWVAVLAFGDNCSEICRATHRLSAAKNGAHPRYWWYKCYRVIHWCSPKRKRQTSELYSHSQFTHMLFTDIEKSKITMLEFGIRQNMTDMDTKRARGKCIANSALAMHLPLARGLSALLNFLCILLNIHFIYSKLKTMTKYRSTCENEKDSKAVKPHRVYSCLWNVSDVCFLRLVCFQSLAH